MDFSFILGGGGGGGGNFFGFFFQNLCLKEHASQEISYSNSLTSVWVGLSYFFGVGRAIFGLFFFFPKSFFEGTCISRNSLQ